MNIWYNGQSLCRVCIKASSIARHYKYRYTSIHYIKSSCLNIVWNMYHSSLDLMYKFLVFSAEGDLKQFTAITDHHVAKHGYDASLFIAANRPQCVHDMYNLCAPNPTKVIRSADLYRKDGLSGSKMFKCWPVLMNDPQVPILDLDLPRSVSSF